MTCRRCGTSLPSDSKFCPNCGLHHTSVELEGKMEQPQKSRKKPAILAIIAGLVVVAGLIILMFLLKGKPVTETAPVQVGQTPVTSAPSAKTPETKAGPPAEIVAYLDHVKVIEGKRLKMRVDLAPAFQMLSKVQSMQNDTEEESRAGKQQDVSKGIDQYTQQWQDIVGEFNAVRPPSGCEQLAGAYSNALGKYSQVMINIQIAISKQDMGALLGMQGTAQAEVDASLTQADSELSAVCQHYGIQKSFGISPDKGVDSLLSPSR